MSHRFLVDTYATERLKVLSVWSMFGEGDLDVRPRAADPRGRTPGEHMIHQCQSEHLWFRTMLTIDTGVPPLPAAEDRDGFLRRYAEDSRLRLEALRAREAETAWWEEETSFFEVLRPRAWILVRRIAHTAHHRGQQTSLLRMLGRRVWSTYGPTADTGGLPRDGAPTVYPYVDTEALLAGEALGGRKTPLPGPGPRSMTERPEGREAANGPPEAGAADRPAG